MFCCVQRPWKSKKPANPDHVQSPESQSDLPLKTILSSGTEVGSPLEAVPNTAEPDRPQRRSSDSNKSGVGHPPDALPAVTKQNPSAPREADPGVSIAENLKSPVPADTKRSRNLWEEAFKQLDKPKQDLLFQTAIPQGSNIAERLEKQVAEQIEKSYHEAPLKKVLEPVLRFNVLIRDVVACDPTGHAAAAWGIVSLGLQMAQNDGDMRKNVYETCGSLAETLTLLACVESSYRDEEVPNTKDLEETLITVYGAVLELRAQIIIKNTENVGQRILASFTKLEDQPLQEFQKTLESKKKSLNEWTQMIQHQYRNKDFRTLNGKITPMLDMVEQMTEQIFAEKEQKILDWLSMSSYDSHRTAADEREPGTGEWIHKSFEYQEWKKEWKKSSNKILWLHGNSGCGKSFLCSKIIDDLETLSKKDPSFKLAYWYFTFSDPTTSLNIDNLISCLIRQLCAKTHTIPDSVRKLWKDHAAARTQPFTIDLRETLDSLVEESQETGQKFLIVLDALDEYPLREQVSSGARAIPGRDVVLKWLKRFGEHANVHILITSRDETEIRETFGGAALLDAAKELASDVDLYIQRCLDRMTEGMKGGDIYKNTFKSQLSDRMIGNGQKRFRWVSLVEKEFLPCINAEMRQEALESLPSKVEDIYAKILSRIPKYYHKTVRLIFMWLAYSIRPLTLQELASAVPFEKYVKELENCTSSLVSLQRENGVCTVKFDHFSVKEYLTLEHGQALKETNWFYTTPMEAHLTIAEISVSHLLKTNDDVVKSDEWSYKPPDNDPLLEYSSMWFKHLQEADAIDTSSQDLKDLRSEAQSALPPPKSFSLQLFQDNNRQSCLHWVNLLRFEYKTSRDPLWMVKRNHREVVGEISPMVIATLLDLPDIVQQLICDRADIDGEVQGYIDERVETRRWWEDREEWDRDFESSIMVAAIAGNLKILKLLLEKGASLYQSDLNYIARESEKHGVSVLSAILEHRKDLAISDETVMKSAENRTSKEILKHILDMDDKTLSVTLGKELLVAIVKRCSSLDDQDDLVEKLLRCADDLADAKEWMLQAFLCHSSCGRNIRLVIDRYGLTQAMAEEKVNWVLDNETSSDQMLPVVLESFTSAGVEITSNQDMLVKAARDPRKFLIILKHIPKIVITKDVINMLEDIPENLYLPAKDLLIDHAQCKDEGFDGTLDNHDLDALYEHIDRCPKKVSWETLDLAAPWERDTIDYLQAHARPNVKFTNENTSPL